MTRSAAETVEALFAAFAARDADAAIALCAADVEFWPQGTAERAGRDEPYRGHAGMREYLADVERTWPDLVIEPGDLRVAGGGVVAFGTAHGTPLGATERVSVPVIWVVKIEGGLVRSVRAVATADAAAEAVGA